MLELFEKLVKKEYSIDIDWKKVKFKQLTFYECMEYLIYSNQEDFDLYWWLDNLFWEKLNYKNIDLKKLFSKLYETAFKWFFKEWKNLPTSKLKNLKSEYEYLSYLISQSWYFKKDPLTILKEYTPEQLDLFSEWLVYKLNEETKIWKWKNKIMLDIKSTDNSERDRILEMTKRIEEKEKLNLNK